MNNINNEPLAHKLFSQVHTTKDYSLFKSLEGNRNKNLLHINRLKKSMQKHYLVTIIMVNENYEIIDGQHRFHVIRELGLPLYYIVCKGYGLREVQILNENSKTWNADDYLHGYCDLGYADYLIYDAFKKKYKIGHNECLRLLGGSLSSSLIHLFYSGDFKVTDFEQACSNIEKILTISPYYAGVRRRTFINSMLTLFNNPNFEYTEFLQKLKLQPTALVDCTNVSQYITLIEQIYNYKRRDKINLRY
jgi:hypothetical protein